MTKRVWAAAGTIAILGAVAAGGVCVVAPGGDGAPDAPAWKTLTNTVYGYSIQYPSDWLIEPKGWLPPTTSEYVAIYAPRRGGVPVIEIEVRQNKEGETLEDWVGTPGKSPRVLSSTSAQANDVTGIHQTIIEPNGWKYVIAYFSLRRSFLVIRGPSTESGFLDEYERMIQSLSVSLPKPTPLGLTPGPGATLWRWANVTILVPDEPKEVTVGRYFAGPELGLPESRPVVNLLVRSGPDSESQLYIDAESGLVFLNQVMEVDKYIFDGILTTLRVGDPMSDDPLPWPYGTTEPSYAKRFQESMRFWDPDPAAGIATTFGCADSFSGGGGCFIMIHNTRSRLAVNVSTREVMGGFGEIAAEDKDAFERWLQSVD